ncbi:phage integrase N-terminal domain-containing protein, partial [Arthrospira platensis SPKY1]|nr:phage integrase N-terminal domain-containing protein [Arthrospira platensis SPKY1]
MRRSADGRKVVSHATINDRSEFFSRMVRELRDLGYPLADVRRLKPKHVEALMKRWEAAALSASTLQKRFSYLTL